MHTANAEIKQINHLLSSFSEEKIRDVLGYVSYIAYRERRRKKFAERILRIKEKSEGVICNSVEDVMEAIYNAPDEDDEDSTDIQT